MSPRISFLTTLVATLFLLAFPARAEEPSAPATETASEKKVTPDRIKTRWSVGAGIGWGTPNYLMSGTGIHIETGTPIIVALIERRLTEHLRFIFDLKGSYEKFSFPQPDGTERAHEIEYSYAVGGSAGVRGIFNPGGVVEVSGLFTLAMSVTGIRFLTSQSSEDGAEDEYVYSHSKGQDLGTGATIGIAFERRLIESLYLRLGSGLAGVSWSNRVLEGEPFYMFHDEGTRSSFRVGLSFSPTISLRLLI